MVFNKKEAFDLYFSMYNEEADGLRDLFETTIKLKCPFHEEEIASFTLNIGKDKAHCFGCGYDSDIRKLVKDLDELKG